MVFLYTDECMSKRKTEYLKLAFRNSLFRDASLKSLSALITLQTNDRRQLQISDVESIQC